MCAEKLIAVAIYMDDTCSTYSQLLPLHACPLATATQNFHLIRFIIEHLDRFCQEDTMHLASDVC